MHILHISNSYGGTEVYTQLIRSLDKLGVRQTVFVPLNPNNRNRNGNYLIDFAVSDSKIIYSTKLKQYHRYLYGLKIDAIKSEIEKEVDMSKVDLIHAGLFCTDGAVAFELSKIYDIPYIVAVRNTDVNFYYKKMWWKRSYFHAILASSKKIVFISHQYRQAFLKLLYNSKIENLTEKSAVLPNGVNSFYLENRVKYLQNIHSPIRVIYAGAFNKGKNILETLYALESLIKKGYNVEFKAIGKGLKFRREDKDYQEKIENFALGKDWIHLLDSMPKESLRNAFEESDIFIMPSVPETFGIVYLEALSQGLPIIYAKGQGFDGYYEDKDVGFAVNPENTSEFADKIEKIIKDYDRISLNVRELDLYNDFSWEKISEKYFKLYNKIKLDENSFIDIS
ncbi:glycosyltransferase family 4 protein [Sphingobacterium sp.]|uniref:glycosyltransferase family 4 protein n=1 Tax=Sphingobacterium sp. TaxID=341027 RepID=UPI0031D1D7D7